MFVCFQTIGSLEEVQMPQNGILHEGIAALAEAFKSNPNLKVCKISITLSSCTVFPVPVWAPYEDEKQLLSGWQLEL